MTETLLITALLPITALMLVTQVSPYQALIIRGIVGAVAALVYAVLGAADVALTEALVGTMLSITLYAIAVRSSMSFRLGVVQPSSSLDDDTLPSPQQLVPEAIAIPLRKGLQQHHLRLEPVGYDSETALTEAIANKEVHGILSPEPRAHTCTGNDSHSTPQPQLQVRLPRLHSLLLQELPTHVAQLTLLDSNTQSTYSPKKAS